VPASPNTFRILLELMLSAGLRAGDAVAFDPAHCKRSQFLWVHMFVRQKLRKTDVPKTSEVFLTGELKQAIDHCHWFSPRYPFAYPESATLRGTAARVVRKTRPQPLGSALIESSELSAIVDGAPWMGSVLRERASSRLADAAVGWMCDSIEWKAGWNGTHVDSGCRRRQGDGKPAASGA
jgi:hypothetical protein